MFGDRGDLDPAPAQHRLERDGVLALAREAREFPDQDLLETGRRSPARLVQHLRNWGRLATRPGLGLIDVLADDYDIAVSLGEVAERAQLRGDGEIDVLAVEETLA